MEKLKILIQRLSLDRMLVLKQASSSRFKGNNTTFVTGIKNVNASSAACRGIDKNDFFDALSYGINGNDLKEIGKNIKK